MRRLNSRAPAATRPPDDRATVPPGTRTSRFQQRRDARLDLRPAAVDDRPREQHRRLDDRAHHAAWDVGHVDAGQDRQALAAEVNARLPDADRGPVSRDRPRLARARASAPTGRSIRATPGHQCSRRSPGPRAPRAGRRPTRQARGNRAGEPPTARTGSAPPPGPRSRAGRSNPPVRTRRRSPPPADPTRSWPSRRCTSRGSRYRARHRGRLRGRSSQSDGHRSGDPPRRFGRPGEVPATWRREERAARELERVAAPPPASARRDASSARTAASRALARAPRCRGSGPAGR